MVAVSCSSSAMSNSLIKNSVFDCSSTHFPLVASNRFFKAVNKVLLEASAWPLLCRYRGVEYKFFIFNS